MEKEVELDKIDSFLDNYELLLRKKLIYLKRYEIPLVVVARSLRDYIISEYNWDEGNVDIYMSKCKLIISEKMSEDQIEKAIKVVKLTFDVQMEVFGQIGIGIKDSGVIAKYTDGISFEMGVRDA